MKTSLNLKLPSATANQIHSTSSGISDTNTPINLLVRQAAPESKHNKTAGSITVP